MQADLARACNVTRQAVAYWCRHGVPHDRALKVAAILGVAVHEVSPDFYSDIEVRR
jgi:hypothetical protein